MNYNNEFNFDEIIGEAQKFLDNNFFEDFGRKLGELLGRVM